MIPFLTVGAAIFGILGTFLINRWYGYHKAKKKYIEVYKNSNRLNHSDFNIAKYNEVYYKSGEHDSISNFLNDYDNILIVGRPKAGKTRTAYEVIKKIKGFKVIKFWENLIRLEELPDNIFKGQIIIFIDDLNKFVDKLQFNRLIKKLESNSKKYIIIITCRSGEEYKQCKNEFGEYLNLKEFKRVEIKDLDESTAQSFFNALNIEIKDFDGTIGSLFLGINDMKKRYENSPIEVRVCFVIIKMLAAANNFVIRKRTLEKVYNSKIYEQNIHTDHVFHEVISELRYNSFIFLEKDYVSVLHDSYLDIIDYNISIEDLNWLKNILFKTEDEDALFNIGNSYYNNKIYKEAIECYDESLEINSNYYTWNNKGIALAMQDKYQEALNCYDKALEINSQNDNTWNNKGISLWNLDKCDEAIECYHKSLNLNPKNYQAWNNKGNALDKLGNYEKAIKCYDKALEINPKYDNALNGKGGSLANLNKNEEAIACYDIGLSIDNENDSIWFNKGLSLFTLGKGKEAIECFDKSLNLNPENDQVWYNKGVVLDSLRSNDKYIIDCYNRALEINPIYEKALFNKGIKSNDPQEALECYNRILDINPEAIDVLYNKGNTLAELGEYNNAIKCFNKVIKINPKYIGAWNNKGNCLGLLNNHLEALKCFDRVLALNPEDKNALYNKERSLSKL